MSSWIDVDGSRGEGGGQVLRSSLGLAALTGKRFRIRRVRAGRSKPGLLRQHLTAARAAAAICDATLEGDRLGSGELVFEPGEVRPGEYEFKVGSAGSATLVLQTVLPALCVAGGPSRLVLEGGTHNPWAPPFDFLARAFLPLLARMGPEVSLTLERPGFYPAGGGRFVAEIHPAPALTRLDLPERGAVTGRRAEARVAHLPANVARRELQVLEKELGWPGDAFGSTRCEDSLGPGNVVLVEVASEHVTEVFAGFGKKGVKAEKVARDVAREVKAYLRLGYPVGEHLADQLLIPMAMAGGGSFRTGTPSGHTRTQREALRDFLGIDTRFAEVAPGVHEVRVG